MTLVAKANRDFDSLSEIEQMQIERFVLTAINLWAYAWKSHRRGQIDDDEWRAWDTFFTDEMQSQAWRLIYQKYHDGWHADFQRHLAVVTSELAGTF